MTFLANLTLRFDFIMQFSAWVLSVGLFNKQTSGISFLIITLAFIIYLLKIIIFSIILRRYGTVVRRNDKWPKHLIFDGQSD